MTLGGWRATIELLVSSQLGLAGFAGVAASVNFSGHAVTAAMLAFASAGVATVAIALNAGERAARHHVAAGHVGRPRKLCAARPHRTVLILALAVAFSPPAGP